MLQELRDFLDNLEFRPLDEQFIQSLWPTILEIIRKPTSNVPAAAVLLLIAVVFVLLLIMVTMLVISRFSEEDEEYEYIIVSADGTEQSVGKTVAQEQVTHPTDPVRFHRTLLLVLGAATVLMLVGGVASQDRGACLSCHDGIAHTARVADDPHQAVRCVACHEAGGLIWSYTLAVPARTAHIASGIFEERARGYGVVTGRSCLNCHAAVTDAVVEIPDRALLVSHLEPLEAGAGCMDCHILDERAKLSRATVGMSSCLRCHDDEQVSAECSECHTGDVSQAVLASRTHESRQLISQPDCYTCHDPAPCDSCHGVRLPHPQEYEWSHMMDAARDIWFNDGRTCITCHTAERNSCYQLGCHVEELDFHRAEDPTFPRTHGRDPEWTCDGCHPFSQRLDDPCAMCH